jgi:hypothetical protein
MKPKTKTTDPLDNKRVCDLVRDTTEASLLRYTAGRVMFCPACEECLDWTTTVLVTIYAKSASVPEERAVKDYVQCAKCFDSRRHHLDKALVDLAAKGITARMEIVDGREDRFKWIEG